MISVKVGSLLVNYDNCVMIVDSSNCFDYV